jgi:NitT/TauT family transport system substrate-binding protein
VKRVLAPAVAGLLMQFGASAAHAAGKLEKTHLDVATTGSVISYYPFEIALNKGYFKDEGLDVERSMYPGGPQTMQALLGGSADMTVSAYSNVLTMAAKGQKLQAVGLMIKYPGFVLGITKKGQETYKTLKDLKGMKIGVTAPGASTNVILNAIAARNGVDTKSYAVIGVGALAGAASAARQGQIDALVGIDPNITMLVNSGDLKVVQDLRTGEGVMAATGQSTYPEGSFIFRQDFVQKNPNTVQAAVNALLRAEKFLQNATPEQIADSLPKSYVGPDRELFLEAVKHTRTVWSTDGRYDPAGAQSVLDILTKFDAGFAKSGDQQIDLAQTYTNHFVEAASVKNP